MIVYYIPGIRSSQRLILITGRRGVHSFTNLSTPHYMIVVKVEALFVVFFGLSLVQRGIFSSEHNYWRDSKKRSTLSARRKPTVISPRLPRSTGEATLQAVNAATRKFVKLEKCILEICR